jgi:hypothetical protein
MPTTRTTAIDAAIILRDMLARIHTGELRLDADHYRRAVGYLEDLAQLAGLDSAALTKRAAMFGGAERCLRHDSPPAFVLHTAKQQG